MALYEIRWYISTLFWLLLYTNLITTQGKCDQLYYIKNPPSGLVLDITNPQQLQIQELNGSPEQIWQFVRDNKAGLFHIVSNSTGTVLEIDLESCATGQWMFCYVRLSTPNNNRHEQQWIINSRYQIVNAYSNQNMDIQAQKLQPGTPIQTYKNTDEIGQIFVLEEVLN